MIQRVLLVMMLVFGASFARAAASEPDPVKWVLDVPVMPDMRLAPELGFSFDSPLGRFLVVVGELDAPEAQIAGFYEQSLTALGWQGRWPEFQRRQERLRFEQVSSTGASFWKITLSPHAGR